MKTVKWFKYFVSLEKIDSSTYQGFSEHENAMGGYDSCSAYDSKEAFKKKYFYGDRYGRFEGYYKFCIKNIPKGSKILSIGSGRGILEAVLSENDFVITASDLQVPASFHKLQNIFKNLKYIQLNAENVSELKEKFDFIILFSVGTIWDDIQLLNILNGLVNLLKGGGVVFFDAQGCSPNLYCSSFLIDMLPKWEANVISKLLSFKYNKQFQVLKKHHGFRRTHETVEKIFSKAGFYCVAYDNLHGTLDFYRTIFFNRISNKFNIVDWFFKLVGKFWSYNRLYKFRKKCEL